jgi:hypothetical protein
MYVQILKIVISKRERIAEETDSSKKANGIDSDSELEDEIRNLTNAPSAEAIAKFEDYREWATSN